MKTRVGKIARLSYQTREQLNLCLLNGELGTPLLQWLNELPETRDLVNTTFDGKPISKQNLSEWRHGGYQDWLRYQQRQERFQQIAEQGHKLADHEGPGDPFENFARIVLAEMAEDLNDLHKFRHRGKRWQRLREIARDLARLQHGYNHGRKVDLSWLKWKSENGYEYDLPRASNQSEQKPPSETPPIIEKIVAVKPGQTQSNQKNLPAYDPFRRVHHHRCPRGCICKECHPDDGPYPFAQAVKDFAETRKPEYWALENIRPFMLINIDCDCDCPECATSIVARASCPCEPHRQDARATTES